MSVFERGGPESRQNLDVDTFLNQKFEKASLEWDQPRQRLKQSIGLFDESSRVIRLVKLRGKIIQTMGFTWKTHRYLYMEEAVFLVDQGYLVLFRETNPSTYHSLLSLQEAMECMIAGGIPLDRYLIYSDLKKSGHVVFRHPLKLSLDKNEDPTELEKAWMEMSPKSNAASLPSLIYQVFDKPSQFKRQTSKPDSIIATLPNNEFQLSQITGIENTTDIPIVFAFESNTEIVYYTMEHSDASYIEKQSHMKSNNVHNP